MDMRIETRGRKPNVPPPPVHWRTAEAHKRYEPAIREIIALIDQYFPGLGIRGFLKEWTASDASVESRRGFMTSTGCK